MSPKSIVALANEKVPFATAVSWAGIQVFGSTERGQKVYCPFGAVEHPDGGMEPAMRVYPDHAWCFAESKYFSVVSLLAEVWQVTREEAATEALTRSGYKPADYAERFATAGSCEQEPDQDALAAALLIWCEAWCERYGARWRAVQYEEAVAAIRARCLGLLPLVYDLGDCDIWLAASKEAMARVMSRVLTTVN